MTMEIRSSLVTNTELKSYATQTDQKLEAITIEIGELNNRTREALKQQDKVNSHQNVVNHDLYNIIDRLSKTTRNLSIAVTLSDIVLIIILLQNILNL